MTWLKISDDFGDECARTGLSDAAFRTHVEALSWAMRRETGGAINARDIRRFAETTDPDAAILELVAAGFWTVTSGGWQVVHHMEHQPEPDLLAKRRANTAVRVARHKRKQAGLGAGPGNGVTERVTGAVTERVTRDGTGRVGSGRATKSNPAPKATTWPGSFGDEDPWEDVTARAQ